MAEKLTLGFADAFLYLLMRALNTHQFLFVSNSFFYKKGGGLIAQPLEIFKSSEKFFSVVSGFNFRNIVILIASLAYLFK